MSAQNWEVVAVPTWGSLEALLHARVQEVIARIAVRHFRYPVEWKLTNHGVSPVAVSLIGEVLDREQGRETRVILPRSIPVSFAHARDMQIAGFLFRMFLEFLQHEAGESFYLDDARVFDPHAPKAPDPSSSG